MCSIELWVQMHCCFSAASAILQSCSAHPLLACTLESLPAPGQTTQPSSLLTPSHPLLAPSPILHALTPRQPPPVRSPPALPGLLLIPSAALRLMVPHCTHLTQPRPCSHLWAPSPPRTQSASSKQLPSTCACIHPQPVVLLPTTSSIQRECDQPCLQPSLYAVLTVMRAMHLCGPSSNLLPLTPAA